MMVSLSEIVELGWFQVHRWSEAGLHPGGKGAEGKSDEAEGKRRTSEVCEACEVCEVCGWYCEACEVYEEVCDVGHTPTLETSESSLPPP